MTVTSMHSLVIPKSVISSTMIVMVFMTITRVKSRG
jgi:hypothetical protein